MENNQIASLGLRISALGPAGIRVFGLEIELERAQKFWAGLGLWVIVQGRARTLENKAFGVRYHLLPTLEFNLV